MLVAPLDPPRPGVASVRRPMPPKGEDRPPLGTTLMPAPPPTSWAGQPCSKGFRREPRDCLGSILREQQLSSSRRVGGLEDWRQHDVSTDRPLMQLEEARRIAFARSQQPVEKRAVGEGFEIDPARRGHPAHQARVGCRAALAQLPNPENPGQARARHCSLSISSIENLRVSARNTTQRCGFIAVVPPAPPRP